MKKLLLILAALAATQISGCATTTNSSVAGVERKQFMMLSAKQVENMSLQSYMQTLKEADGKKA